MTSGRADGRANRRTEAEANDLLLLAKQDGAILVKDGFPIDLLDTVWQALHHPCKPGLASIRSCERRGVANSMCLVCSPGQGYLQARVVYHMRAKTACV